ncbi:hypothetical protein evm_007976 [Chilo suppressalis]|nr:hypothetical protein evm_007976 [Chilo suppressalis]
MNFGGTLRVNKFACFTVGFILFLIIYWRTSGSNYPSAKSDVVNLKQLLKAAIRAAERGGKKVIEGKNHELNIKSKGKTLEGANDPVTDADYASHCAMYYSIKNTFPKLNMVSEEHSKGDASCEQQEPLDTESLLLEHKIIDYMNDEHVFVKDVTVWIDPLDATQEYTETLYQYVTTMVCVAIKGIPVIGVIHYPFPPSTYWGWYTKKTSSNIASVPHQEENKEHPRVVVSRSHPGKVAEIAKEAFGAKTTVTPAAGAGFKIMAVVNGTYDVYLHATAIKKWDLCAGNAIIKAVDGKMTTTKGENIDYSSDSSVKVTGGIIVTRVALSFSVQNEKERLIFNAVLSFENYARIDTNSRYTASPRLTLFQVTSNNALTLFLKHTTIVSIPGIGEFTCREVNVRGAGVPEDVSTYFAYFESLTCFGEHLVHRPGDDDTKYLVICISMAVLQGSNYVKAKRKMMVIALAPAGGPIAWALIERVG